MKRTRSAGIIIKANKIVLMHRIKYGAKYYVFPGGGVEIGETTEETALREVLEETTLTVKIEKLLYQHIYDDNSEQFFYLCNYISGEPKLGDANEAENMLEDPEEFYDPNWYPLDKLSQLLLYPLEIRDWLIEDLRKDFGNTPKVARIKISELRRTL